MHAVTLATLRRVLLAFMLEAYAVLLALYQSLSSVQTDEAKYLLNIPYPHPPLARYLLHLTEAFPYQELLWRIVFATLLVQAVWIVARMAKNMTPEARLTLCGFWVFSGSVLFQSGTIMMAVLTALQGLLFVWLMGEIGKLGNGEIGKWGSGILGWVALLWLASLFTAYQAILYLPIVSVMFYRARAPLIRSTLAIGVPVLLTTMYVASNPLAAASFIHAGGQNANQPLLDLLQLSTFAWLWAGSAVLSVAGLLGMARGRQWALLASVALVFVFHMTSYRSYYPVLFLPLLIAGVALAPSVLRRSAILLALQIVAAVLLFAHSQLAFNASDARIAMQHINALQHNGVVLISGGFGHQWQYESTSPIYRYKPELLSRAKAVVCLEACPEVSQPNFYQIGNVAVETWLRKESIHNP